MTIEKQYAQYKAMRKEISKLADQYFTLREGLRRSDNAARDIAKMNAINERIKDLDYVSDKLWLRLQEQEDAS